MEPVSFEYPNEPDEIFWMLLTFMTLTPEEQLSHLPYVPSSSQTALLESSGTNPLLALTVAMQTFGWRDALLPDVGGLDAFEDALRRLAIRDNLHLFCREEFLHGAAWEELRTLARAALRESKMGSHPLPETLDFGELIEFSDG
jgi:hypothetical protein